MNISALPWPRRGIQKLGDFIMTIGPSTGRSTPPQSVLMFGQI